MGAWEHGDSIGAWAIEGDGEARLVVDGEWMKRFRRCPLFGSCQTRDLVAEAQSVQTGGFRLGIALFATACHLSLLELYYRFTIIMRRRMHRGRSS